MNNCKKTVLNSSIANSALLKIGEARLKYVTPNTGGSYRINLRSSVSQTIQVLDGNLLFDGNQTFTINTTWPSVNYSGEGMFSIPDKYSMLTIQGVFDYFDLSDFVYSTGLTYINLQSAPSNAYPTHSDINLELIQKLTALTTFRISAAYKNCMYGSLDVLYGNNVITDFAITGGPGSINSDSCTNIYASMRGLGGIINVSNYGLTAAYINNMSGSVEDFVNAKRDVGVSSGSATFKWLNTCGKLTWKGSIFPNNVENDTITWTATTITFREETIEA